MGVRALTSSPKFILQAFGCDGMFLESRSANTRLETLDAAEILAYDHLAKIGFMLLFRQSGNQVGSYRMICSWYKDARQHFAETLVGES